MPDMRWVNYVNYILKTMLIKTFAALAAIPMLAGAAHAGGFYATTEVETDFKSGDYNSTELEVRAGYEGELSEKSDWYIELGPTTTWADGGGSDTQLGVEVGADYALTEKLTLSGDIEMFSTDADGVDFATTVGAKYRF